ncbi:AAA family ATPase, partial [Candidatus Omnitrophota bacterium]
AAAILSRTLSNPFFENYEYVIIDSPPSFGFLTLNSMYAADMIVVPMDLSYFSFNGTNSVYRVTSLLNAETGRSPSVFFAINIYDKRSNFAKQFEKDAIKKLGPYLLPTKIRSSVRLREAARQGRTIFEYDPKCPVALDFYNLTSEILTSEDKQIKDTVREFLVHAPQAGAVYVLGDFNDWQKAEASRLNKLENGQWSAHFTLKRGTYRYKFLIDDEWTNDPENSDFETNIFGTIDSILKL